MGNVERAQVDDIRAYQAWMKKHTPIDKPEARFLEHEHDLVTVVPQQRQTSGSEAGRMEPATPCLLLLLCVLPLVAFAVITGFLARILLLLVVGVAEMAMVSSTGVGRLMSVREWSISAVV